MCLILIARYSRPEVALQIAANRDELFARPASPADWWTESSDILAGRDLQAGGTWLGVSRSGRFAAITNFRDPASRRENAPSRGSLVGNYLQGKATPTQYLDQISAAMRDYNGFSLLVGDREQLWFLSNRGNGMISVPPGIHGLSNHLLNEPWPKVNRGKARMAELIAEPFDAEGYFSLLADEETAPDDQLPQTGISLDRERKSSAIRIRDPIYGTRCSTILQIAADGNVELHERSFSASGNITGTVRHSFQIRAD